MKKFIAYYALFTGILVLSAGAATNKWTGAVSTAWSDAGNWTNGVPQNNDTVYFEGTPVNQPDIGSGDTLRYLIIESDGWVFSSDDVGGNYGNLGFDPVSGNDAPKELIVTNGSRVIMNCDLVGVTAYRGPDMFVGPDSTLIVNGNVVNPTGRTWTHRGSGSYVFTGTFPNNAGSTYFFPTGDLGSHLINSPQTYALLHNSTLRSGHTLGGTIHQLRVLQYQNFRIGAGGTFSPGGNAATVEADGYDGGELVNTNVYIRSANTGIRAGWIMNAASTLEIDIGGELGLCDHIEIGALSQDFNLNGCTLALRSAGATVKDGDYTIVTETVSGSDRNGTFGTITWNGEAADPENVTVTYNATNVVVTLSGLGLPTGSIIMVQ